MKTLIKPLLLRLVVNFFLMLGLLTTLDYFFAHKDHTTENYLVSLFVAVVLTGFFLHHQTREK